MLKKKLIKENTLLFERLNKANKTIAEKDKTIEKLKSEIDELKSLIEKMEKIKAENLNEKPTPKPSEEDETPKEETAEEGEEQAIESDIHYGSSVIGKIVVCATEKSNALSANSKTAETKELINLILGKTEVAKSEILSVVLSEKELSEKKQEIDKIYEETLEYFEGVMQQ